MRTSLVATGLAWFFVGAILVTMSIAFIDRPVARFVHGALREPRIAAALAHVPETRVLVPLLAFLVAGVALAAGIRAMEVLRIGGLAMASFAIAEFIKIGLKIAFGRPWPETWIHNNPSFIRDGVYAFSPFHGGQSFASFPSGHMTAASSVMVVAWLVLPRGRPLWALVMLGAAVGLVAMNYHFVADVIAGFFLGTAVAVVTVRLARRAMLRVVA